MSIRVVCQTPKSFCTGRNTDTTHGQGLVMKMHSTHEEAFRCYRNYLTKQEGYTQIGGREFRKEGHPILVLTKKCRYGARMKQGKHAQGSPRGNRMNPKSNKFIIKG